MNLKKITLGLLALTVLNSHADAQLTSAAPYCDPGFRNQYNMFNTIKIEGTSFSFGAMGDWKKTDPFLYYNTTTFPDLEQGNTADIEIVPYAVGDIEPIYFAVWIDYDHSNTFDAAELVMQNSNTIRMRLPFTGDPVAPIALTITVPATAMLGKTRMRVMRGQNDAKPYDPYSAAVTLDPCHTAATFAYGCTYDFDVTIVVAGTPPPPPPPPPGSAPKADFSSSATSGTTHTTFTFTDKSTNKPTSWYWTFSPAATVSHVSGLATSQNISVVFTMPGKYAVQLVAANAHGKDSVIKTDYIISLPTSIGEHTITGKVLFSPNPAIAGKIRIDDAFIGAALIIVDLNGKQVLQQEKIGNGIIDISSFQSGMYFLSVRKDGLSYVQSLQVNQ
jgi:hypothetical protein